MYENKKDYDRFCIDEVLDKVRRKKKKNDRRQDKKQKSDEK